MKTKRPRAADTWFVGTNFGHDSAAALVNPSGELVFAIEEGRLLGVKNCSDFPSHALALALEVTGHGRVAWGEGWDWPRRLVQKGVLATARFGTKEPLLREVRLKKEIQRFAEGARQAVRHHPSLRTPTFVGHHLSHALSLLPCGLQADALVLVSDTTGERDSVTVFHWDGRRMVRLAASAWPHSPGAIFHQSAYFAGFAGERGPGKLMALSAYGTPFEFPTLTEATRVHEGRFEVDLAKYPAFRYTDALQSALGDAARWPAEVANAAMGGALASDFAATVQSWFEATLLDLVSSACRLARSAGYRVTSVGLSGGSALNCQANGRLWEALGALDLDRLIVGPWSNDAGTAAGAAVAMAMEAGVTSFTCTSPLLGPQRFTGLSVSRRDMQSAVARLASGGVVSLVSGGVEFGPRALGGRSLLIDARLPHARQILNEMKGRPSFMPFAPALRSEAAKDWFLGVPSTDMAWTVPARAGTARLFPGIDHPSGAARVQAVVRERAPLLYDLLLECEPVGIPMVLLTSLNGAGEPMLASHAASVQAARSLGASGCLTDSGWNDFE